MKTRRAAAFTLVELLVVVALVAGLAIVFLARAEGGGSAIALQAGQATLANAVTAARVRAVASGRSVRLLVHDSPRSAQAGERFRRLLVLAEEVDGEWRARDAFVLPERVYLLPHRTRVLPGMFATVAEWKTADGREVLGSTALGNAPVSFSYDAEGAQSWEWISFTARGTVDGAGALVLAAGRGRTGSLESGRCPIEFVEPMSVRGVMLSNYGVPRWLNDRTAF